MHRRAGSGHRRRLHRQRGGSLQPARHDAPFDYYNFYEKELQLRGVFRYRGCYPAAIAAVAAGKVDLRALADRVFPFTESPGAFEYALAHSEEALKVMIEF